MVQSNQSDDDIFNELETFKRYRRDHKSAAKPTSNEVTILVGTIILGFLSLLFAANGLQDLGLHMGKSWLFTYMGLLTTAGVGFLYYRCLPLNIETLKGKIGVAGLFLAELYRGLNMNVWNTIIFILVTSAMITSEIKLLRYSLLILVGSVAANLGEERTCLPSNSFHPTSGSETTSKLSELETEINSLTKNYLKQKRMNIELEHNLKTTLVQIKEDILNAETRISMQMNLLQFQISELESRLDVLAGSFLWGRAKLSLRAFLPQKSKDILNKVHKVLLLRFNVIRPGSLLRIIIEWATKN
ncbi:hypothetical protein CANARDRAFT_23664 [[Candida] arabinofermentans NRRL YB-2248]|uniref:Uncharacterized protein n=1 Tax=[Candida] arabinofermentans NRRL YB-2248 TaxID=983967 RepID=A0A1E4SYT9_9ASCO|nr:hypothetical protein CANARDRAFT_23664 [[Candida] arabinofermentans NRRL YB-2248]